MSSRELDADEAGQLDQLLDRLRGHQADLPLLQGTPYTQHDGMGLLMVGLGGMRWPARAVVQALPPEISKALPPFAQPRAFARDTLENLAGAPAFEPQPNRLAAPLQLVILVCHTVAKGGSMAATKPCLPCREPFVN